MSISSLSIKRPVLAIVMNLMIIPVWHHRLSFIRLGEFRLSIHRWTVRSQLSGANADIIESQITVPLEKR